MSSKLPLPTLILVACTAVAHAQPDCSFPSVEPRHWYQDAFPSNETITSTAYSAYDSTSAWIRTGLNLAQLTGTTGRQDLPGDTVVAAAAGANLRLDLVFRILPGPGNYVQNGNRNSGLRRVPTATTAAVANAASANFWESYLADNGAVGTSGNGVSGPGHPLGKWDQNVWNSARCDTAETNIFPVEARLANMPALTPGRWASMYHEADPKYVTLGIPKNRCFLVDPAGAINSTNITCGNGTFPPPWTANPNAGMMPSEGGLAPGLTREFSQIIPDGQLTPGSHVQYFLRVSDQSSPLASLGMNPDTNFVLGQGECSQDCARWASFGILPDRWKDPAFGSGGIGMARMLVIDLDDGGGDECAWVSIADTLGITTGNKRGSHNGWSRVPPGGDLNDPAYFVRAHLGQAGACWDFYQVRGSRDTLTGNAGSIGSRFSPRCAGCPSSGRESRQGPTSTLLRLYRTVLVLSGDRNVQILGSLADRGQDDVALLQEFATLPGGTLQPRQLGFIGSGFGESEAVHNNFLNVFLRASLRSGDYSSFAGNPNPLVPLSVLLNPPQKTYGLVPNSLDVFDVQTSAPAGQANAYYENVGAEGPYVASVFKQSSAASNFVTVLDGFGLRDVRRVNDASPYTRHDYVRNMIVILGALQTCPFGSTDVELPALPSTFMSLTNNPLTEGTSTIRLRIERAEHTKVAIYDIAGRCVKTLADGELAEGLHTFSWDGTDAAGGRASPGVYWVRATTASGTHSAKTLVVLR